MFTVFAKTDKAATFHFDANGETPRRWHCTKDGRGRWVFNTDFCYRGDRKPGIPCAFRGADFATLDAAVAAVLAAN